MPTYTLSDIDRILAVLAMPGDRMTITVMQGRLNELNQVTFDRIMDWVTEWETARLSFVESAGTNTLIQADVLKWSSGGQGSGTIQLLAMLKSQISSALRLSAGMSGRYIARS